MKYKINNSDKSIEYNGEVLYIPRKEFLILSYLQENPNRIISREEFIGNIWEKDVVVLPRTIDVHIRKIRKRFPNAPIKSRRCYGYFWKSDILQ
jgi:two-component system alkaline phosphatase synthesis response regulator PhoP